MNITLDQFTEWRNGRQNKTFQAIVPLLTSVANEGVVFFAAGWEAATLHIFVLAVPAAPRPRADKNDLRILRRRVDEPWQVWHFFKTEWPIRWLRRHPVELAEMMIEAYALVFSHWEELLARADSH